MSDELRSWMLPDGKPGAILEAMHAAAKSIGALEKRGDEKMAYTNIDDVRAVARRALVENGVVITPTMLSHMIGSGPKAPMAQATVCVRFTAAIDGTYIEATITGAGQAGMGRSLTVATTAAIKQALINVLQIASNEGNEAVGETWTEEGTASKEAKRWYMSMRRCTSIEGLMLAVPGEDSVYSDRELEHGRVVYAQELTRLRESNVADNVERYRSRTKK